MHRRRMILGTIVVVILIVAAPVADRSVAQDGDVEWRYAYSDTQLVAYSLDGEVNVLYEGAGLFPRFRFMFENQNALIELEGDETHSFYHLTPQGLEPVPIDTERTWLTMAGTERYVVIHGAVDPGRLAPNILYDAQTRQVHELQGVSNWPIQTRCCGISADGTILRYLSFPSEESGDWSIIERSLETGEEQVFFAPDLDLSDAELRSLVVGTDAHGDRWYWRYVDSEAEYVTVNLVNSDGSNTELDTFPTDTTPDTTFVLAGEYLVQVPIPCDSLCTITVLLPDGEEIRLQTNGGIPTDLIRLREDNFLMEYRGRDFYLISTDAAPQLIGTYSPLNMFNPLHISPDGRWYTLLDDGDEPTTLLVWDAVNQTPSYEYQIPEESAFFLNNIAFSPFGQILHGNVGIQDLYIAFDYASGNAINLPSVEGEFRIYFEMLEDGSVLLFRFDRDGQLPEGILRYDPNTGDLMPILTDARWEPVRFLEIY